MSCPPVAKKNAASWANLESRSEIGEEAKALMKPTTAASNSSYRPMSVAKKRPERWDSATSLTKVSHDVKQSFAWVRQAYQEYVRCLPLASAISGQLTVDDFKTYYRKEMNLTSDSEKVLRAAVASAFEGEPSIGFPAWVIWYTTYAFVENFVATSAEESELRSLAKFHSIEITEVQRIKQKFKQFDTDGSGYIEENEFTSVLCSLLKVSKDDIPRDRLHRAWLQAQGSNCQVTKCTSSHDGGGLNLERFLIWYKKYMYDPSGTATALEIIHGIQLPKFRRVRDSLKRH